MDNRANTYLIAAHRNTVRRVLGTVVACSLLVVQFKAMGLKKTIMRPKVDIQTFTNPVNDVDMPDPGVLRVGSDYWMTHTMGRLPACPLWHSKDLVHWTFATHLLDSSNAPAWVHDRFWAPEIHRVKDTYILLYTSGDVHGRLCIGSAISDKITSPYRTFDQPLIHDPDMGMIDPTLFADSDGKVYLIWKDDGNAVGKPCHIFARRMDPAAPGVRFAEGEQGKTITLLISSDHGWEGGIIEGPEMVKHGDWYYLFYSGNGYDRNYAEGVARSRMPTGPFEKCPNNPILRANDAWANPGHGAFITDSAGTLWHLYHAYHFNNRKLGRVQLLDAVHFENADGWPQIGANGSPTILAQAVPITGPQRGR